MQTSAVTQEVVPEIVGTRNAGRTSGVTGKRTERKGAKALLVLSFAGLLIMVAGPARAMFASVSEIGTGPLTAESAAPGSVQAVFSCPSAGPQTKVSWTPVAAEAVDGYEVRRLGADGEPIAFMFVTGGTAEGFTDTTVGEGSSYTYEVRTTAAGMRGEIATSSTVQIPASCG